MSNEWEISKGIVNMIKADLKRENIPGEKAAEIWNIGLQSFLRFRGTAKTMVNPRLLIQMYDRGNKK